MYPLKWLKPKRLTASYIGEDVEQLELSYSFIIGCSVKWYNHVGKMSGSVL